MENQKNSNINPQKSETEAKELCSKIFDTSSLLEILYKQYKVIVKKSINFSYNEWWVATTLLAQKTGLITIKKEDNRWSFYLILDQSWTTLNQCSLFDIKTWFWYKIFRYCQTNEIQHIDICLNLKKNATDHSIWDWTRTAIKDSVGIINEEACISVYTTLLPKIQKLLEGIATEIQDNISAKLHEQKEATANAINNHLNNFNV
jgi:hypothetical protein